MLNAARFVALSFLVVAAGCSGGSGSLGPVPAGLDDTSSSSASRSASLSETPSWSAAPGSDNLIYVANAGDNSITIYRHTASGNTPPLREIKGPRTELRAPGPLSQDADGNLYVTNDPGFGATGEPHTEAPVLVFAHDASGDAAPLWKIEGPATQITAVEAAIVDKKTGDVYVFNEPEGTDGASTILRFRHGAHGNATPELASEAQANPAVQLALNSSGNIIEAHSPQCCAATNYGISTFPTSFTNGAVAPELFSVIGFVPNGVADDYASRTFLVTGGSPDAGTAPGIYRFAEDTNAYFAVYGGSNRITPPIVSVITSDTCGSQMAIAPGSDPKVYVVHSTQFGCPKDAVYVYAHDATGDAEPIRTLTGRATRLDKPSGIAVRPLPGYRIDHVDIDFLPHGHPGMPFPHYDIHGYYVSHAVHQTFCTSR